LVEETFRCLNCTFNHPIVHCGGSGAADLSSAV